MECDLGRWVAVLVRLIHRSLAAFGLHLQHRGDWKPVWVRGHPGQAAAGMITWHEQGLTDLTSAIGG